MTYIKDIFWQFENNYQEYNKCFIPPLQDANAWALLGHTHYLTGDYSSAKDAYERTISYVHLPAHVHIVYLRLADIYLKEKEVHVHVTSIISWSDSLDHIV